MPVLEKDYTLNQKEIEDELISTRGVVSDNANMINKVLNSSDEVAKVLASEHAKAVSEWASEDISLTPPQSGSDMMNILIGLLGIGGLGGVAGVRKIMTLSSIVKKKEATV